MKYRLLVFIILCVSIGYFIRAFTEYRTWNPHLVTYGYMKASSGCPKCGTRVALGTKYDKKRKLLKVHCRSMLHIGCGYKYYMKERMRDPNK